MSHSLTTQEAEEARTLIARLAVLLEPRKAAPDPPAAPVAPPNAKILTPDDYAAAAARLRCAVPEIRAVYEVESAGIPFGYDGRATALYEGHKFSEFTGGKFDNTYGGVSWPAWDKKKYPRGTADERHRANWDKILFAARLDRDAAYKSASYGGPQIMGFNFAACGFSDVHSFVAAMNGSARGQLDAFVSLILDWKLDDELRERRWVDFARRYNGPRYAENAYDTKLAKAYTKWAQA
jgi:hypothetical protein